MDKGAYRATVCGITESDMTEHAPAQMSLMDIGLLEFLKQKFPFKAILKPPVTQTSWQGSWSELGLKIFSSN